MNFTRPYEHAIGWLHRHSPGGVCVSSNIRQALYRYRVHDHSITPMDRPECLRSWARVIKKNKLYGIYPNALAMWVKSFFV